MKRCHYIVISVILTLLAGVLIYKFAWKKKEKSSSLTGKNWQAKYGPIRVEYPDKKEGFRGTLEWQAGTIKKRYHITR